MQLTALASFTTKNLIYKLACTVVKVAWLAVGLFLSGARVSAFHVSCRFSIIVLALGSLLCEERQAQGQTNDDVAVVDVTVSTALIVKNMGAFLILSDVQLGGTQSDSDSGAQ